jgi:hypothetical protein
MPAPTRTRGGSASPAKAAPRSDAYTGLLVLSLLAMAGGGVLLWMDLQANEGKPNLPPTRAQAGGPGAAPAGPVAPGVPNPPPDRIDRPNQPGGGPDRIDKPNPPAGGGGADRVDKPNPQGGAGGAGMPPGGAGGGGANPPKPPGQ